MFYPEGVYVAMLTPFDAAGAINEEEVRHLVDFAIDRGVDGLFPVSTVGEFIHMAPEEKVRLMQIVTDQAGGRVKVTPGVGTTSPDQSISLARQAEEMGCDGVVIAPPYFFPLSQEMVEEYFETIADAVDIPIIIYNIPLFTQPLSYEVVKRLSRRPNVVGMKDSSGSMVDSLHFMDVSRQVGEDISFLTGREETLFPSLMVGAKGCMAASAGIVPELMVTVYRGWKEGDYDRAVHAQLSILPLVRAMFSLPFPMGFKAALEVRGFQMGPPRQPFSDGERSKSLEVRRQIEEIMKPILEEFGDGTS